MDGTPVEGGQDLIRHDPKTTGRKLFEVKCGSCHSFSRQESDFFKKSWIPKDKDGKITAAASDLGDFGTAAWVRSLLKDPMQDKHFGLVKTIERDDKGVPIKGDDRKDSIVPGLTGMRGWRKNIERVRAKEKWDAAKIKEQEDEFDVIAKWLAYQATSKEERKLDDLISQGQAAFAKESNKCAGCHQYEKREKDDKGKFKWVKDGQDIGPDLTNYGSAEWIRGMIMNPWHKDRYGTRNLMTAFRNIEGPGADILIQEFRAANPPPIHLKEIPIQPLSDIEREMIIRWMWRDYRAVYGGATIAK